MTPSPDHFSAGRARRCLVTGSRGFIGRHVVRALHARGWKIRCLTRQAHVDLALDGIEILHGDLASSAQLQHAVADTDCVFHLAGEKRDPSRYTAVNVDGTRALLDACALSGAPALVHLSSVGVTGPTTRLTVDEETPCQPEVGYEQSKFEAEALVRSYAASHAPAIILRPANVFGDGDPEHHLLALMQTIVNGRFRLIGRRPSWVNYVYAGDVAGACALAADAPSGCHTYQLADPCTIEEFASAIAVELSVPTPLARVPMAVGYPIGAIGSMISALSGRPFPVNLSKIRAMRAQTRYSPARFQGAFPDWPAVGWRDGLRHTIAAYRAEGLI